MLLLDGQEPDEQELRRQLRDDGPELAAALGICDRDLLQFAEQPAEVLAGRLRQVLERARLRRREDHLDQAEREASSAAAALGAAARRLGVEAHLDLELLLAPAVTRAPVDLIAFEAPDLEVMVRRASLVRARRDLPRFPDLRAFIDPMGLQFRWRAGRGRLVFYPQKRRPAERVLVVPLPARTSIAGPRRASVPTPLADILGDLGFFFA